MSLLTIVIGQAQAITQRVMRVLQAMVCPIGGEANIAEHKPQLVSKELKAKRSRVQQGKQEQLLKTETSCVPTHTKKSLITGTQSATLVSKPANQTYKRKLLAVQADTKGQSLKQIQKPAPVGHIQDGSQAQIAVSPSSQPKRKRLVAPSIKVVKSSKQELSQQDNLVRGKQQATPVSKTPHHAKSAAKRKP